MNKILWEHNYICSFPIVYCDYCASTAEVTAADNTWPTKPRSYYLAFYPNVQHELGEKEMEKDGGTGGRDMEREIGSVERERKKATWRAY